MSINSIVKQEKEQQQVTMLIGLWCNGLKWNLFPFDLLHRRQIETRYRGLSKKLPNGEWEGIFYRIINASTKVLGSLLEVIIRESVIVLLIDFFSAMFSRFMNTGSQFVMEGVKNLVVGNKVS